MNHVTSGILAIVLSGALNGSFTYPMKLVGKWRWENIWFLFGAIGLVILPMLIAFSAVPRLLQVYGTVAASAVLAALGLGLAWGVGSLLLGLAISALGMSLGYAIIMGTTAVFGTLVPVLVLEPGILATGRGLHLLASLVSIVAGLVLCAVAGLRRDRLSVGSEALDFRILTRTGFQKGLLMCLLSGVFSACFNIGFALTTEIAKTAERFGARPSYSTFAIWALIMSAGFVPSCFYCVHLFRKNRSFALFATGTLNWVYAVIMGCLWIFGVMLYGSGAYRIGARGAAVGWPILMSVTIIAANVLGFLSGEWRGAPRSIRMYLYGGLIVLLGAVVLAGSA